MVQGKCRARGGSSQDQQSSGEVSYQSTRGRRPVRPTKANMLSTLITILRWHFNLAAERQEFTHNHSNARSCLQRKARAEMLPG